MDLITRLLTKDASQRIGSGPRNGQEIIEHPFFREISWDRLIKREIIPPFIPEAKKMLTLQYFHSEFTNMALNSDDHVTTGNEDASIRTNEWPGFSYQESLASQASQTKYI
jgi:serine/threonine protein kinase